MADTVTDSETIPIRVFVTDDHEVVRRGLRELIEVQPDMELVGEAEDAATSLARIPPTRPDVVVLDVRLPDGDGIEVCREIRSRHPEIECLLLTSYSDDEALFNSIMAGAAGYVLKRVGSNEILEAVRRVAAGEAVLDPAVTKRVLERIRKGPEEDERLAQLEDQEREILELIAEGYTNREIADRIHLAEKTVRNYVSAMLKKLGMHTRTEAAVFMARIEEQRGRG